MTGKAVTDMRGIEQDGDCERYADATRWQRELAIQKAYLLRARLNGARSIEEREEILQSWALESGRDVATVTREAAWTEGLHEADLRGAFAAEHIPDEDWLRRIDIGHLMVIGEATDQATHRVIPSKIKAEWVLACYHANWTAQELRGELVRHNLVKALPGPLALPTKSVMATQALMEMLQTLQRSGTDFKISLIRINPRKPLPLFQLLTEIRDTYYKLAPRTCVPQALVDKWALPAEKGAVDRKSTHGT